MGWNSITSSKDTSAVDVNSVVDLLKALGQDSSFQGRGQLWSQVGKGQYKGTQQQNDALRTFLKGKKAAPPAVPSLFSAPYQPQMMPRNPQAGLEGRPKAEIMKEMISALSQLIQKNPKDPMIGMYRQFIRSKLGQMEQEIPQ